MPLFGELALESVAPRLPALADLDTEPWDLPKAEILQLALEVPDGSRALLPRAMHPAIPAYVTFVVLRAAESPVGPFTLAQLRLMGRAGAHPRGLVLSAIASTRQAAAALRERWGIPAHVGAIGFARYHDRIVATVARDGALIGELALVDPEIISGADVQYIHSVTLAQVNGGPALIQVDPHYTFHRAERGRPHVARFDAPAWDAPGLVLREPIAASVTTCDTDLPRIRFVMDPVIPVVQGTRRIR